MGNCLVTKLKESVNNPNLPYLGYSKIAVSINSEKTTDNSKFFRVQFAPASENTRVFFEGTGFTYDLTREDQWLNPVGPMDGYLNIAKYGVQSLTIHDTNVDISSFDFPNIESIELVLTNRDNPQYGSAYGDIAVFKKFANLTELRLDSRRITGDVADLGYCVGLTETNISVTSISGKMEEFIANQVKSGRTTGSITTGYPGVWGEQITFRGVGLYSNFGVSASETLTWTPNASDSTKTDITWGSYSETIDANGNIVS